MNLYELAMAKKLAGGGGGGDEPVLIDKNINANGTYNASSDSADGYKKVVVSVPASGITPSGTSAITSNGIYDVTNFASASVNVPIPSGYIQPSGTSSITANGIYDITNFASVDVNVSGGGGGGDDSFAIIERTASEIINDTASQIGSYAFYFYSSILARVSMASVSTVGEYAFRGCTSLTEVSLANAKYINAAAFMNCVNMSEVYLPKVFALGSSAFQYCSALSVISLPKVQGISANAFKSCTHLMSVYLLLNEQTVTFANFSNAFSDTPITNSTYTGSFGSIYVPASRVSTYQSYFPSYSERFTSYVE